MNNKSILITEDSFEVTGDVSLAEGLLMLGSAVLNVMQQADHALSNNKTAHGDIYDTANIMFGNILDKFDHNRSPQTDLTAEAILKAENEILDSLPEKPNSAEAEAETATIDATDELVTPAETEAPPIKIVK